MSPTGTGLTITNPLVLYRSLIATKHIAPDPSQLRLALHLQKLYDRLKDYEPSIEYSHRLEQLSRAVAAGPPPPTSNPEHFRIGARGIWKSLLAQKEKRDSLALTRTLTSHEAAMGLKSPLGLILHGEVGTGKSMLIDLFADSLPTSKKKRYHFNTFMLDSISKLESFRKSRAIVEAGGLKDEHSLLWLARDLVQSSPILFLDEFQLPDRAASKILSTLMTCFFQLGGVLIATSNRMPEELAKAAGMEFSRPISRLSRIGWRLGLGGIVGRDSGAGQMGEFAQFLEVLRARCEVWEMEGKKDYRRISGEEDGKELSVSPETTSTPGRVNSSSPSYNTTATADLATSPDFKKAARPNYYLSLPHTSADSSETSSIAASLNAALSTATSSSHPIPWKLTTLTVYGRQILIPRQHSGVALFTFSELCGATLGPADYITIASTYHTLALTSVPILTFLQKNEARRFITLLDALYEARCRLLITAEAGPDDILFPENDTPSAADSSTSDNDIDSLNEDATHAETYSEIHQDLTSPFRPNISSYGGPTLAPDALEDDPPNRFRRPGSSFTDERTSRGVKTPDFANIGGLTGEDERFAVKRAQSRIWEMCSAKWWARGQKSTAVDDASGWWRPLPVESRHWEGRRGDGAKALPKTEISSRERVVEEVIEDGASPFRTSTDAPPKIDATHVWGTVAWGKRAGAWGKGVEGLQERKKEKADAQSEETGVKGSEKREKE